MSEQTHRLAAIMFTDIVGYTALMDADEDMAMQLLEKNRSIQRPIIEKNHGTWLKEMGDGVLASFETVSAAVYCAKEIQENCVSQPDLSLRIGIHLGEVVVQNNDVFGSGVNLASRLEEQAPAGGIYISESVHKNVINRKGITTKFVKETVLKHVKEPVRIYEVIVESVQTPTIAAIPSSNVPSKLALKKVIQIVGGIIALLFIVFSINQYNSKNSSSTTLAPSTEVIEKSIAVLPFHNDSEDKGTEYFANGVMEAILNHLSKIQDLKVISRTSMEQYRETTKSTTNIADELGVAHLLEGSVQKYENQVRVTVQLIHTRSDQHLWSEIYDRDFEGIFNIQTDIAENVAKELRAKLTSSERKLIGRIPTTDLNAYDFYLKGKEYYNRFQVTRKDEDLANAATLFSRALASDSTIALAYVGLGSIYLEKLGFTFNISNKAHLYLDSILFYSNLALGYDPDLPEAYALRGIYFRKVNKSNQAFDDLEQALSLNPNLIMANKELGWMYYMERNDPLKAFSYLKTVERLEKGGPGLSVFLSNFAGFFWHFGDYNRSEAYNRKALKLQPDLLTAYGGLAWIASAQGKFELALTLADTMCMLAPDDHLCIGTKADYTTWLKNYDQALEYWEKVIQREKERGEFNVWNKINIGYIYWQTGRKEEAMDILTKHREFWEKSEAPSRYYNLACYYAILGEKEQAIDMLKEYEKVGFCCGLHTFITYYPVFETLWNNEEFQELIKRVEAEKAGIRYKINQMEANSLLN